MQCRAFLIIFCSNNGLVDYLQSLLLRASIRSQVEWKTAYALQAIDVAHQLKINYSNTL